MSVSGELEQIVKENKRIKWTEVARKAIKDEAEKMKKYEIFQKYIESKPISREDWKWMNGVDWHPVDEMEFKPDFVKETLKAGKSKPRKIKSLDELL